MKNKITAILLSVCLFLTLLAGCGNSVETAPDSASEAPSAESVPVAETAEEDEAPAQDGTAKEESVEETLKVEETLELPLCEETQTLTYFNEISTNLMNVYNDLNEAEAVKYLEELTNVHIDFTNFTSDNYKDQYSLMVASGDMTDIIYAAAGSYPGGASAAVEDEVLINLDEYMEYAPHYAAMLEEFPDVRKAIYTDEGYLPAFYSIYDENARFSSGMVVRQDWLDELGMNVPVTYDDYHDVLSAFKSEYNCASPILMGYNGMIGGDWLIAGYGVVGMLFATPFDNYMPFYVDGTEVKFGPMEEGYKEYLTMLNQWYSEGLFSEKFLQDTNGNMMSADYINQIIGGDVGMAVVATSSVEGLANSAVDENFELTGVADAVKNEGDLVNFGAELSHIGAEMLSISTSCEDIELAMRWIDVGYTEVGAYISNYGVEGYSYEINSDGVPEFTDLVINNESLTVTEAISVYTPRFMSAITYVSASDCLYTEKTFEAMKAWGSNRSGEGTYPALAIMTADETDTFNTTWSDIAVVVTESTVKFITGDRDLAEYDDFVSTLESMGIEECISLKQDAYDRYLAK